MAGLREKNKKRNQKRIFKAASALIRKKGYKDTSMGDIAKSAGVAVGTLYNYYGSKIEILSEFVHNESGDRFRDEFSNENVESLLKKNPVLVFQDLFGNFITYSMTLIPEKEIWRELFAASFTIENPKTMDNLYKADIELMENIGEMVVRFQKLGKINPEVAPDAIVMIMYGIFTINWMEYMIIDIPLKSIIEKVREYIGMSFTGFLPEKELNNGRI